LVCHLKKKYFFFFVKSELNIFSYLEYATVSARAFPFSSAKIEIFPDYKCPQNFEIYENKVVVVKFATFPINCPWVIIKKKNQFSFFIFFKILTSFLFYLFTQFGYLQIHKASAILFVFEGPSLAYFNNVRVKIPLATITSTMAQLINERKKEKSNLEMDFSEKIGYVSPNPVGYSMSYFSSWGLSDILDIKVTHI